MGMKGVLINLDEKAYEIAKQKAKASNQSFTETIRNFVSALAAGKNNRQNVVTLQKLELELDIKMQKFGEMQAEINDLTAQINSMKEEEQQKQLEIIRKEEERIQKSASCALCNNEILDDAIHLKKGINVCKSCFYSDQAGVNELLRGENAASRT